VESKIKSLRKKEGFFFSLDSFMGLILFVLTLAMVYGFFVSSHSLHQEFFVSEDLLNIFTNIKIDDLDLTNKYQTIDSQVWDGKIKDSSLLLIEGISILNDQNNQDAVDFFNDLVYNNPVAKTGLVPVQYDIDVIISDSSLLGADSQNARSILARQRLISKPVTTTTTI